MMKQKKYEKNQVNPNEPPNPRLISQIRNLLSSRPVLN